MKEFHQMNLLQKLLV